MPVTQSEKKKRRYTPRSRACKMCGESFKPKKRSATKFCSTRCRVAHHRAESLKALERAGQLVKPMCEWCGKEPSTKGSRFCTPKHRRASWKAARLATIEALALHVGKGEDVALDIIENLGIRIVRKSLEASGFVYRRELRAWSRGENGVRGIA